jgi:hypothetical protein
MGWDTFWAIFSQTHLVTLFVMSAKVYTKPAVRFLERMMNTCGEVL